MARMKRVVVPGYPHHITQRGNRRQKTFFCTGDYQYYLELMAEAAHASGTEVWAYCLMPNHVHMVMVPAAEDGLRASYLLAAVRYVELNPVKAKLCRMPQDWRWSSAYAHLAGRDDRLVKVGPMLDRVADWSMYLASDGDSCDELLDRYSRTGRPLGDEQFVRRLESLTGAVLARKQPGRKSKGTDK